MNAIIPASRRAVHFARTGFPCDGGRDARLLLAVASGRLQLEVIWESIMSTGPKPRAISGALSESDARALLARHHVGRLCFLSRGLVNVEPVQYVLGEAWLLVRSANGTEIDALADHPYVAFEVDEFDDAFQWRSVVAHGMICLRPEDSSPLERRAFDKALKALRSFIPQALRRGHPTFRRTVYGIDVDVLTGRRSCDPTERPTSRVGQAAPLPRIADEF
jgi:nitroimidazol reductase NimA-like FMN-containing flavoprotein (pyridoxamine 5'-phosphate oxidase superfamily)